MFVEYITGLLLIIGYFLICIIIALLLKHIIKMHTEVFRKILHLIALCASFIFVFFFEHWFLSVAVSLTFAVLVYLVLTLGERFIKNYSKIFAERKRKHELKNSNITTFIMYAIVITICWGFFNDKMLVLACVFAWGVGDGLAAVIGKLFGKVHIKGRLIEGVKSVEGTVSMFFSAFLSVLLILLIRGGLSGIGYVHIAFTVALVVTFVELFTKKGMDTISCPISALLTMLPMVSAYDGFQTVFA